MVTIRADLEGLDLLIGQLKVLRDAVAANDCPHTHLLSPEVGGNDLSTAKLKDQTTEVNGVNRVKIYGWNAEWAVRHGLTVTATTDRKKSN